MASDHRGRELHAGKRTSDAMRYAETQGWRGTSYTTEIRRYGETVKSPLSDSGRASKDDPIKMRPTELSGSHFYSRMPDSKVGDVSISGQVSGRPEEERMKWEVSATGSYGTAKHSDIVKTPLRAMIAAEAMKNRIKEGRDLKTGRPKK